MRREAARQRGFTLVEVMLALGILFAGLVILIKSTAENIATAQEAQALGVATGLARGKMYDLEERLLDPEHGFQELDEELSGDFSDEDWPNVRWEALIEKVEIPNMNVLSAMDEQAEGAEAGEAGMGGGMLGQLGGMLGMGGGMGGMGGLLGGAGGEEGQDLTAMMAGNLMAQQFEIFRMVLEASIRKVTLKVHWKVLGDDKELTVICYFTEPAAMNKVIATGQLPYGDNTEDGSDDGGGGGGGGSGGSGGSGGGGGSGRGGK